MGASHNIRNITFSICGEYERINALYRRSPPNDSAVYSKLHFRRIFPRLSRRPVRLPAYESGRDGVLDDTFFSEFDEVYLKV